MSGNTCIHGTCGCQRGGEWPCVMDMSLFFFMYRQHSMMRFTRAQGVRSLVGEGMGIRRQPIGA